MPDIDIIGYLPMLLDGLMGMLSDPNKDIQQAASKVIKVRLLFLMRGAGDDCACCKLRRCFVLPCRDCPALLSPSSPSPPTLGLPVRGSGEGLWQMPPAAHRIQSCAHPTYPALLSPLPFTSCNRTSCLRLRQGLLANAPYRPQHPPLRSPFLPRPVFPPPLHPIHHNLLSEVEATACGNAPYRPQRSLLRSPYSPSLPHPPPLHPLQQDFLSEVEARAFGDFHSLSRVLLASAQSQVGVMGGLEASFGVRIDEGYQ